MRDANTIPKNMSMYTGGKGVRKAAKPVRRRTLSAPASAAEKISSPVADVTRYMNIETLSTYEDDFAYYGQPFAEDPTASGSPSAGSPGSGSQTSGSETSSFMRTSSLPATLEPDINDLLIRVDKSTLPKKNKKKLLPNQLLFG